MIIGNIANLFEPDYESDQFVLVIQCRWHR